MAATATDGVLLLHGQPGTARDWSAVVGALPKALRAVAIDRPGWAEQGTAGDLDHNARAAADALDAVGMPRATIVGHSFGAAVAAWLAVHEPERVAGLVLVAPAANAAALYTLDRALALPLAGYAMAASAMTGAAATLAFGPARRLIGSQLQLQDELLRDTSRLLRRPRSWGAFAAEQRALIRQLPELEDELHRITAPTTIVVGDEDRVVPPSSARRLAQQIPGARLIELERGSHLLPFQHPERLAAAIAAASGAPRS